MSEVQAGETLHLSPDVILADDNIRFGLKAYRIEALAENIMEVGRVINPVTVEPLPKAIEGKKYRLTSGFYRHAAVTRLNNDGAGIQLPAIVEPGGEPADRLRVQTSENLQREDMSPMDKAVAIKKLVDAGVPKVDICKIFSFAGGRKGFKVQPASNSFINMMLSFLDFPKNIQNLIHEGKLPVGGAYELRKHTKEKWEPILAQYEKERLAAIDQDERMEEKYLEDIKKAETARLKAEEDAKALEASKELVTKAQQDVAQRVEATAAAHKAFLSVPAKDKDAKAKAQEAWKALEKDLQAAQKAALEAQGTVTKLEGKVTKNAELAKNKAAQLADARKKAPKGPGASAVKKAAAKVVDNAGRVPLTAPEMKKVVAFLCGPSGFPKVQEIGNALQKCFNSEITDGQLLGLLATITGEKKQTKVKKEAAETAA